MINIEFLNYNSFLNLKIVIQKHMNKEPSTNTSHTTVISPIGACRMVKNFADLTDDQWILRFVKF